MNKNQNELGIENKMIRPRQSKIKKKKILIHLANQNLLVVFDSLWRIKFSRIKMNRIRPSPDSNYLKTK